MKTYMNDTIKENNVNITKIPGRDEREKRQNTLTRKKRKEKRKRKIMVKNFPHLWKFGHPIS